MQAAKAVAPAPESTTVAVDATPSIPLSVVRASKTSVTIAWQPFGGATVAESKRKCFCVLQDDEMTVVTEQNEKTVAVITDVAKGNHVQCAVPLMRPCPNEIRIPHTDSSGGVLSIAGIVVGDRACCCCALRP